MPKLTSVRLHGSGRTRTGLFHFPNGRASIIGCTSPPTRFRRWRLPRLTRPAAAAATGKTIIETQGTAQIPCLAQAMDCRANFRLDWPISPACAQFLTLCDKPWLHSSACYDPIHAAQLNQINPLSMNPNFLDQMLEQPVRRAAKRIGSNAVNASPQALCLIACGQQPVLFANVCSTMCPGVRTLTGIHSS